MAEQLTDNFEAIYNLDGVERERLTRGQLVQQTAEGKGIRINKIHYNRIIKNIELKDDTATATLILRETVHKMQLRKSGDDWQISRDVFSNKLHG